MTQISGLDNCVKAKIFLETVVVGERPSLSKKEKLSTRQLVM